MNNTKSVPRALVAMIWSLVVMSLIFPPNLLAAAGSSDYQINWPESESELVVSQVRGGYLVRDEARSLEHFVDEQTSSGISVQVLRQESDVFFAIASVKDSFGKTRDLAVTAAYDAHRQAVVVNIYNTDGSPVVTDLEVIPPDGDSGMDPSVIVIIVTVAVSVGILAVLGCAVLGGITNCLSSCQQACGPGQMLEAEERFCGRCSCTCQILDDDCPDSVPLGSCN